MDQDKRRYLAEGIESIAARIVDQGILFRIDRKLVILKKANSRISHSLSNSQIENKPANTRKPETETN